MYLLTAKLSVLLFPGGKPGEVLWLPAAIALAAVFVLGWHTNLGIFAGSLIFSSGGLDGAYPYVISMVIALGACGQASIGAWMLHKVVANIPPKNNGETLQVMIVSLLISLISSSVTVLALRISGELPGSEVVEALQTWWGTSAAGLLLLVPVLILGGMRILKKQKIEEGFAWLITSFLFGVTLLSIFSLKAYRNQLITEELTAQGNEIGHQIEETITHSDLEATAGVQGLFAASENVKRDKFSTYANQLLKDTNLGTLAWVPVVDGVERSSFEQAMRSEGIDGYVIHEEGGKATGEREVYFPIAYIAPKGNERLLGYDYASNPAWREVSDAASDLGELTVSAPGAFPHEKDKSGNFLVVTPVYSADLGVLKGFVVGTFQVEDVVLNALKSRTPRDLEIYLFDADGKGAPQFLMFYPSIHGKQKLEVQESPAAGNLLEGKGVGVPLTIGNREWLMVLRAGPEFGWEGSRWLDWLVLVTGLLLTSIFMGYTEYRQNIALNLTRSETMFRALSDYALTGIVRADTAGTVLYANQAMAKMLGLDSPEELVGRKMRDFLEIDADFALMEDGFKKSGKFINQAIQMRTAQGEARNMVFSATTYNGIVSATVVDMTDEVRRNQEVQKLWGVVSQMADTVVITNVEGVIEYVNPSFEKTTGYSREEAIGKTPAMLNSGVQDEALYQRLWQTILGGEVFQYEFINRKKNGEQYAEMKTITPLRDRSGQITHFLATGKDNTEKRQVQLMLARQSLQLRTLYEASQKLNRTLNPQDIYQAILDFISGITQVDSLVISNYDDEKKLICCQAYWLDGEWLDAQPFPAIPLEEEGKGTQSQAIRSGKSLLIGDFQAERRNTKTVYDVDANTHKITPAERREEEEEVVQSVMIVPLKHEERVQGVIQVMSFKPNSYTRDQLNLLESLALHIVSAERNANLYAQVQAELHERIQTEEALRQKESEYRMIADNTGDVIWILDQGSGKFTYLSPSIEKMRGFKLEEALKQSFNETISAESVQKMEPLIQQRVEHFKKTWLPITYTDEVDVVHRDGRMIPTEIATTFVKNPAGRLQIVGISRDIHERKEAEAIQKQQREKLMQQYQLVELMNSTSTRFINLNLWEIDGEIRRALGEIGKFEQVDRSYIFLLHQDEQTMSNSHEWCAEGVKPEIQNLQNLPVSMFPWWMEKLQRGEEVYIPSVSGLPAEASAEREILEMQHIQSLLVVPLVSGSKLMGFAGFDAVRTVRYWSLENILLIRMMGDMIANVLLRKQSGEALQRIERRNSALIENAPDGIALVKAGGEIEFVSPSACRMFDYCAEDILGRTMMHLIHPEDRRRVVWQFRKLLKMHTQQTSISYRFLHKDGTYRWLEATFTNLLEDPGVKSVVLNFRDVTEKKQAEMLQEMEYDITQVSQEADTLDELYPLIHNELAKVMKAENFYIALYDENNNTMEFAYAVDKVDPPVKGRFVVADGLTSEVLKSGKSLLLRKSEPGSVKFNRRGVPSKIWLGVPLRASGKTIGAMTVQDYQDENAYTEREQKILEFVSAQIATAIMRKQNEEVLRRVERRNQLLIENAPDGILLLNGGGRFSFGSPSAARIFGYEKVDEMMGMEMTPLIYPDDQAIITEVQKLFEDSRQPMVKRSLRARRRDGEYRWLEATFTNLLDEPEFKALVVNFQDVTEQRRYRELVLMSQESLENAQAIAKLGSWQFDLQHPERANIWSKEMFVLFNREPAQGAPREEQFMEMVHPDDRAGILAAEQWAIESGEVASVDYRFIGEGQDTLYFRGNLKAIKDEHGNVRFMSGTALDITERKRTELELRGNEQRLKQAQEIAKIGSWDWDLKNPRIRFSDETFRIFGIPKNDVGVLYDEFAQTIHPEDREMVERAYFEAVEKHKPYDMTYRLMLKNGEVKYVQDKCETYYDAEGKPLRSVGTTQDITARRGIEMELRERVKELTFLFQVSRILENYKAEKGAVCQEILKALPAAMTFTQSASAMIQLDDALYGKEPLDEDGQNRIEVTLEVGGVSRGKICIDYGSSQTWFLTEEHEMLRNAARMLSMWLEQRETELAVETAKKELETLNQELEQRVEERTQDVRRSEATYRGLFENSSDGIFLISPNGEDLDANQHALKMLGYTRDEYLAQVRKKPNGITSPEQQEDADRRIAEVLRGEKVPLYERTFSRKDGTKLEVEINLSAIRDAKNRVFLVQSVVRDITERKKAEETLRVANQRLSAANAALEEAARMKDEFLASMSHELRTPLTGILGLSEALQMQTFGDLSEKQLRAMKNIESGGRHLLDLINDILDLSKIEAGKLDMRFEMCLVADVCRASMQLVKGMAHQKQQMLHFKMTPEQILMRADARRLKQMLVNLLSNAVKFTPEGGELGLEVEGELNLQKVYFHVWDKGMGIAEKDQKMLFQPFVQLDSSLTRHHAGTGLGLALVHKMAEMHGGSVTVESTPGVGSRFTLTLPWVTETEQQIGLEEEISQDREMMPNVAYSRANSPLVMVADDNEMILEMLQEFLKAQGYRVETINSGLDLLARAPVSQPDVLLIDVQMPVMDGFETMRRVRQHEDARLARTPIIAITALAMSNDRERCMAAGASVYMSKPIKLQELLKQIEQVLKGRDAD